MDAGDILESSGKWLRACDASRRNGLYGIALYSLEMSVEMALKAVLYGLGIDVPKTHNIAGLVRAVAREDTRIGEEFKARIDEITDTFSSLVEYRAPSAYSFEYNFSEKELKEKLDGLYGRSKGIIQLCKNAVPHPRG